MINPRQVIALGGCHLLQDPGERDNTPMLQYLLNASGKENPAICFIPTASGDDQAYIDSFYERFGQLQCRPSLLSLFRGHTSEIEPFILSQDVIYVGGGNTRNMLVLWREWGLDKILRKAYEQGVVMSGVSAGSICWFEQGLTDSIPGQLTKLDCLGWLPGSNCPHFDGEAGRRPAFTRMIASGEMKGGTSADDDCALHYMQERLVRVVASRPEAQAYRFQKTDQGLEESLLRSECLTQE